MNVFAPLIVVAVVAGAASAVGGGIPTFGGGRFGGPGPNGPSFGSGSGGDQGGSHSGYGRQPAPYNYYPPPPPQQYEQPLTELDQLNDRFNNVLDQLKTAAEIVEALSAQLSQQKRFLDELTLVTAVELTETDQAQDTILEQLEDKIAALMDEISNVLTPRIQSLTALNEDNTDAQELAINLYAAIQAQDIRQDRAIQRLYRLVRDLKDKLFQVKGNMFDAFDDQVEVSSQRVASIRRQETRRKCESGQVTLDNDDRRVEYQYQTDFESAPYVTYGLCGFDFNIDSRPPSFGYGYGYGYPTYEPHSIGIRTQVYSTPTGLNVEMFDTGFGESTVVTGTVCFQACSITPW